VSRIRTVGAGRSIDVDAQSLVAIIFVLRGPKRTGTGPRQSQVLSHFSSDLYQRERNNEAAARADFAGLHAPPPWRAAMAARAFLAAWMRSWSNLPAELATASRAAVLSLLPMVCRMWHASMRTPLSLSLR
jgi:hypothetical protein